MLARLLLLLILVPLVDLLVLLWIAQHTSAVFAFALVIISGIAGTAIVRWQGFRTWRNARQEMNAGQMPAAALFDGLLIFVAGLLLIVPGVLTDVCGLALLMPPVRRWMRSYVRRRIEMRIFGPRGMPSRDTIIESRVIDSRIIESPPPESDETNPRNTNDESA